MKKYSKEEKMLAIQAVEAGESISSVGKRLHISRTIIQRNLRSYQLHGEIKQTGSYQYLSAKQKEEVLSYMHENHLSFTETGVRLGINNSAIWKWEKKYLENGIDGLENKKSRKPRVQKPKPPKTRLEELEEENLNLRIENEYLKKLNALVAEREKRERGNR